MQGCNKENHGQADKGHALENTQWARLKALHVLKIQGGDNQSQADGKTCNAEQAIINFCNSDKNLFEAEWTRIVPGTNKTLVVIGQAETVRPPSTLITWPVMKSAL